MLTDRMDRSKIIVAQRDTLDNMDNEYWRHATMKEKLQTITYLRECFYGENATTGRLQRVHTMFKLK